MDELVNSQTLEEMMEDVVSDLKRRYNLPTEKFYVLKVGDLGYSPPHDGWLPVSVSGGVSRWIQAQPDHMWHEYGSKRATNKLLWGRYYVSEELLTAMMLKWS